MTWLSWGMIAYSAACMLSPLVPAFDTATAALPLIAVVFPAIALFDWMLTRQRLRPALVLLAGLSTLGLSGPDFLSRVADQSLSPGAAAHVRIVLLNAGDENRDFNRWVEFIKEENADIVVLVEAREEALETLRRSRPDLGTRITCAGFPYCGVTILSRFPGRPLDAGWLVDDGLKGREWSQPRLRFASVALAVPTSRGTSIELPVAGIHISRNGSLLYNERELSELAEIVRKLPGAELAVLAGDFNTSGVSYAMRRFESRVPLSRRTHLQFTWPSSAGVLPPLVGIDHVFAGRDWQLEEVETGPDVGSDHRPIIVDLALKP